MIDYIIDYLFYAIVAGTPLLFGALGEIITEKSGNLNLGVEGMMLMGAAFGFKVGYVTQNAILAMVAAMIAGALGALIYAILTVTLRANQVVSGLTLTIFGSGIARFIGKDLIGKVVPDSIKDFFNISKIPLLGDIPLLGPILFRHDLFVYIGFIIAIILGIYLFRTRFGLNLRAVGENASAADASGINVNRYKYSNILLGGALCGLGGAYLSLIYVPSWQENVTAGRGWIAVALVIFCSWSPYKALLGAYLFGGLDILGFRLQILGVHISQFFLDMIPYVATIVVIIIGSIRSSKKNLPPGDLGTAYFREER